MSLFLQDNFLKIHAVNVLALFIDTDRIMLLILRTWHDLLINILFWSYFEGILFRGVVIKIWTLLSFTPEARVKNTVGEATAVC